MNERRWIDIEPTVPSLSLCVRGLEESRQSSSTLSNDTSRRWRSSSILENQVLSSESIFTKPILIRWSLESLLGSRRRIKEKISVFALIFQEQFFASGHSGRSFIDPTLQDNVIIESGFFQQIYHIGCGFNHHSIINNGLIPGGQDSSRRQTVFFLPVDPRDKDHEDFATVDFNKPRRAQYMQSAWKQHQDAEFWVDIDLAIRKGLTFYQTRSNALILQGTLPAYCIPKVVEKSYVRNHTCFLDHHQRSHYDTITIGLEGKFNWVLQLNNSQSVKLFDSHEEKFNAQRSPN